MTFLFAWREAEHVALRRLTDGAQVRDLFEFGTRVIDHGTRDTRFGNSRFFAVRGAA